MVGDEIEANASRGSVRLQSETDAIGLEPRYTNIDANTNEK